MSLITPDPILEPTDHRDAFDLRASLHQIWEACRIHAWLLAFTPLVTLGLIVVYLLAWPPIYSAQATLLAESDQDTPRDQFYYFWDMFRKEDVKSEVGMMTSDEVLSDVVRKLDLRYKDVYHTFFGQAAYLWTESLPGRTYKKLKKLVWPHKPGEYEPTEAEADMARTVQALKDGISITPLPESHVGVLKLKGPGPRVGEIANAFIRTLLEDRRKRYVREATLAYEALKPETEDARKELFAAEAQRKAYFAAHDLLMEFEKEKIDLTSYGTLDAAIGDMQAQLDGLHKKEAELQEKIASEPAESVTARVEEHNPARTEVERQRTVVQAALAQALVRFRPDAPEVQDLRRQIAADDALIAKLPDELEYSSTRTTGLTDQLKAELDDTEVQIAAQTAIIASKKRLYDNLHKKLESVPGEIIDIHAMERDESALEKKYTILKERLEMAQVSIAAARSAPESIKVIDWAEPPSKPDWPDTKVLILAAIALGMFAGVSLAMLLEVLLPRVTISKLRQRSGALPLFATLNAGRRGGALDLRLARVRPLSLSR